MALRRSLTAVFFVIIIALSGCSSGHIEAFGLGAASGSALTHTLDGVQKDLDARQATLIAQRTEILDSMDSANSDAEKLALQAKVDALEVQLERTAAIRSTTEIAARAAGTDFTDPEQAAPWLSTGLMAALWFLKDRKNKSLNQILTAVNEGVEKFKAQSQPDQADRLYAAIKERKQLNGIK